MAPAPWFPFTSGFGEYSLYARIPSRERRHGIEIEHPRYPLLPKIGMASAPLALAGAVQRRLFRQIRDGADFDLIDAHYFYPDGVAAVLLGLTLGRPAVVTARGSDLNIIADFAVPRRWIRWAAGHAAGLVTVSGGLRDRLAAIGAAPERIRVLRNGVDLTLFQPGERESARRSLGLSRPTLAAVGNLVPLKRHRLVVEALAELPEVDLLIVGDGPERAAIEARARACGTAPRVRFLGRLPQERLPAIYSAADLLVLASRHEGWPNVLLESMACGTPVIVCDIPGIAEIVAAPEAGSIAPAATPTALAAVIRERLAMPPDRAGTRRYAEQFGWESTTQGQISLFSEIVEQRARAPGYRRSSRS